jgi:DNA-binding transcriptional ArsR family regulator
MSLGDDDAVTARLRAVAHPIRLRIMSLLTGVELSAAEIARELGITQANASYHVRTLARAGLLVETGVEHVRGGRAKKYRYLADQGTGGEPARAEPPHGEAVTRMVEAYSAELRRRVGAVRVGGKSVDTDAELWIDPQIWAQVIDQVHQASTLAHQSAQLPRTPGTVRTSFTAVLFEMIDPQEAR